MASAWVAAIAAASVAGIAWSRGRTGEYCSPSSVVVAAWGATASLYLLRLIPYFPMSFRAAAVVATGVGCLLVGILAGERWARAARPAWIESEGAGRWLLPYAVAGLAGFAWYLWLVDGHLGWRVLLENARLVRIALGTYQIPSSFLFLEYFCIVAVLLAVALRVSGQRLHWWQWLAVVLCLAATWLSTDRTQFYTIFLSAAFMVLYHRGPAWRGSQMLAVSALGAVLLSGYFLLVGLWVGKTPQLLGTDAWFPEQQRLEVDGARATHPSIAQLSAKGAGLYLYATGSYPAFSAWIEQDRPYTWGLEAIYPIARALDRFGVLPVPLPSAIPEASVIARKGSTEIAFNAYTFLYYPMRDFGVLGVIVYSLVVGGVAGVAYGRVRRARSSALHLLVVAQVSTALTLSVFVNKFNNTGAWYVFALTVTPFLVPRVSRWLSKRFCSEH